MGRVEAERDVDAAGLRATASAYAELVRVPNLFTAPPDVILGAALVAAAGDRAPLTAVGGLAVASTALYAGGTTLNDAFDAPEDARERPERPIPSGRVDRRTAFGLGFGFLLVGVAAASVATGGSGAVVAALLAAAIVVYDGVAKGTGVGFLVMGATRGLNVVLGTTAVSDTVPTLSYPTAVVPLVVVGYVAAVTHMAAGETEGDDPRAVALAGVAAFVALLAVGWVVSVAPPGVLAGAAAVAFAVAFLGWVGGPLRAAYADPAPDTVGPAVGACVLGLVLLDAAFAAVAGVEWALATAAFLVPAWGLSRAFAVS